MITILGAII